MARMTWINKTKVALYVANGRPDFWLKNFNDLFSFKVTKSKVLRCHCENITNSAHLIWRAAKA